jgi:hypothetical protein
MSGNGKKSQISGRAKWPHGATSRLLKGLNDLESFWKALIILVDNFDDKQSAGVILIRFAAKVWVDEVGGDLDVFRQHADEWVTQYNAIAEAEVAGEEPPP